MTIRALALRFHRLTLLLVPQAANSLVEQPQLLEKLDQGAERTLTLVCAPAGYGKTTVLAEWISRRPQAKDPGAARGLPAAPLGICWVALDDGDNDPAAPSPRTLCSQAVFGGGALFSKSRCIMPLAE